MNDNYVVALILIFLCALASALMFWGGICKKCESWKTRRDVYHSTDDHYPGLQFQHYIITCLVCEHSVDIGQTSFETKPRPNQSAPLNG